jgi:hypothetical protein
MSHRRTRPLLQANTKFEEIRTRTILNDAIRGKLNIQTEVTLTANAASTTLADDQITTHSTLVLVPLTANAAAAITTTWHDAPTKGSCVINHANNAQTDRDFDVLIFN